MNRKDTDHTLKFWEMLHSGPKSWTLTLPPRKTSPERTAIFPKSVCEVEMVSKEIRVPEWLVEAEDLWDYSI